MWNCTVNIPWNISLASRSFLIALQTLCTVKWSIIKNVKLYRRYTILHLLKSMLSFKFSFSLMSINRLEKGTVCYLIYWLIKWHSSIQWASTVTVTVVHNLNVRFYSVLSVVCVCVSLFFKVQWLKCEAHDCQNVTNLCINNKIFLKSLIIMGSTAFD